MGAVKQAAKACGVRIRCCATGGHFFYYEEGMASTGVDAEFAEVGRVPREDKKRFLASDIARADTIVIATDNDSEGHAIAADVAGLSDGKPVYRMLLPAIDVASFAQGWDSMEPFGEKHQRLAVPGKVRRVVDRLIGSVFSDPFSGVACGRVQTALLPSFEKAVRNGTLHLRAPAADGKGDFYASVPLYAGDDLDDARAQAAVVFPALAVKHAEAKAAATPWNYADAMAHLARRDDIGVTRASHVLQDLYEWGEIAYPRVTEQFVSESTALQVDKVARAKGLKVARGLVTQTGRGECAHEALRPTRLAERKFNLDSARLSPADAFVVDCGRQLLTATMAAVVEYADTAPLPEWAHGLIFSRTRSAPVPWKTNEPPEGVILDQPDMVVFQELVRLGIGKPSTYAQHVEKFLERGLIGQDCLLTEKGRAWLAKGVKPFDDPVFCVLLEMRMDACNRGDRREFEEVLAFMGQYGVDVARLRGALQDAVAPVREVGQAKPERFIASPSDGDGNHLDTREHGDAETRVRVSL